VKGILLTPVDDWFIPPK